MGRSELYNEQFSQTTMQSLRTRCQTQKFKELIYNLPIDLKLHIFSFIKLYLSRFCHDLALNPPKSYRLPIEYIKLIYGYDWSMKFQNGRPFHQIFVNFDVRGGLTDLFGQYRFGSNTQRILHCYRTDMKFLTGVLSQHDHLKALICRWTDDKQDPLVGELGQLSDKPSLGTFHLQGQQSPTNLLDGTALTDMLLRCCYNLTCLSLAEQKIKDSNAIRIAKNLLTLTQVDLSDNKISDLGAIEFFRHQRITYLNLSRNKVSNVAIQTLKHNQTLTYLNLFKSTFSNCAQFICLLEENKSIQHLRLGGSCCGSKSSQISSLLRVSKQLRVLDLNNFDPKLDDSGHFGENIPSNLEELYLRNSIISDRTILQMKNNHITVLELSMILNLSDTGLLHIATNLKQVRVLILISCEGVTANGVASLFNDLPCLETIDLSNNSGNIDFGDFELIEAMKNNITVKALKLSNNYSVTDDLIQPLIEHNHTIQALHLNSTGITPSAFKDLPDNPALNSLALCYFGNSQGTQLFQSSDQILLAKQYVNELVEILSQCHRLTKLDLGGVRFLTQRHTAMLLSCRNLQKVTFQ